MRCVAEVGYAQATIREIARMANVTSASLYNYFPNKSELIQATIAARADAAMPRLREAAEGPGDIVDRIEAVLDECGNLMRKYPRPGRIRMGDPGRTCHSPPPIEQQPGK